MNILASYHFSLPLLSDQDRYLSNIWDKNKILPNICLCAERLAWTEEERRRRKQTFTLDVTGGESISPDQESHQSPRQQRSRTHHQRSSPHRNGTSKRSQASTRVSPQREEAQIEDGTHVPTSDDSSCSHRCPLHHHHHLHPGHSPSEQQQQQRYRRSRESPRRKSASRLSDRRRSNEDKNAALTGSLPRRRSRGLEYLYGSSSETSYSRLSPGGGVITTTSSGRYGGSLSPSPSSASTAIAVSLNATSTTPTTMTTGSSIAGGRSGVVGSRKASNSAEVRLKAISAESFRSASPGSDSVFFAVDERETVTGLTMMTPQAHCHQCGREVVEDIVQPPAGFADSPEGGHRPAQKHSSGQRLFKKFDKRYRSEDRSERRHHRDSLGRSDVRAKSEERGAESSRYGEDFSRKRFHTRSTEASMEILTGREDEGAYVEPYTSSEWIYIGEFEESHVWKRPDSRDGDDELECHKERRGSQESTESERMFRKKYQAATLRMVHRKSVGEMYKRIQTKCFESDKRVIVRREAGGEFGFRIHGSKPVVVSSIEPDTPAESSGLEVGDIVMSVNGKSVMDATHSEVVRLAHSGSDVLELEVARTCDVLAPQATGSSSGSGSREVRQEPAICSGYLWRKAKSGSMTPGGSSSGSLRSKWVRRWFALRRDNCLYYYKTDSDSQPVGAVMLLKYDAELTLDNRPHSFAIRKRGAPTLHLAADSEEAANRWCSLILEAVDRNDQADTCWLDGTLSLRELSPGMIQRPDCAGYLNKQHERVRRCSSPTGWARRYCLLKDAALYFYEDADSEQAFGVALLHGYRVHASAPTSGGRRYAFELQPPDPTQRIYTFAADSEMDKKRWIAALEYSIDRWIKIA
ncbi:hypothetical protein QAD02_023153 [Eretmocerus hayati]|uniref:Uncharacterized protein n=1 Tax=Eretmocerus hayati TaxID=131215 RepID=A0ACC2PVN6_9HYME|nr:hypothetical protein QAD02_023153 [Eretmocerus hayati]